MEHLIPIIPFQGYSMRPVVRNGEVWFVAKDACDILEIGNVSATVARLPEKQKGITRIDTLGGPQDMVVVSEAGLYTIAFRSRKPEAEEFTAKVAEFLAEHRKAQAKKQNMPEVSRREMAQWLLEAETAKEALEAQVAAEAPLVAYALKVQASPTSYTVDTVAKELGLPVVKFREFVHSKYLFKRGRDWLPYAEYQTKGWFEVRTRTYDHNGIEICYHTTTLTGVGRVAVKSAWDRSHTLPGMTAQIGA